MLSLQQLPEDATWSDVFERMRMLAAIEEAEKIAQETGAVMMGQFTNPANPATHERTTGPLESTRVPSLSKRTAAKVRSAKAVS